LFGEVGEVGGFWRRLAGKRRGHEGEVTERREKERRRRSRIAKNGKGGNSEKKIPEKGIPAVIQASRRAAKSLQFCFTWTTRTRSSLGFSFSPARLLLARREEGTC
jgi:hypothetical protein